MDMISGRPIAAVRVEGTIANRRGAIPWEFDEPLPGVIAALESLRKTHFVILVTSATANSTFIPYLYRYIADNAIPYDDVWAGFGIPDAELWVDNKAVRII